jgi:hypothetical protein
MEEMILKYLVVEQYKKIMVAIVVLLQDTSTVLKLVKEIEMSD